MYVQEMLSFINSVKHNKKLDLDFKRGLFIQKIIHSALKSAEEEKNIYID